MTASRHDDLLRAVRARLAVEGLSTRPWILLDRYGAGIAFDDTDTLVAGAAPQSWQAVERVIKAELWELGLFALATVHKPETGVVRIAYEKRTP